MSDPIESTEQRDPSFCPTCGSPLPPGARYCPTCGTRVRRGSSHDQDAFRTAVDDVLDDREDAPVQSTGQSAPASDPDTAQLPVAQAGPRPGDERSPHEPTLPPPSEPTPPAWTTSPSDWTIQTPPSSGPPAPPRRRENRTLWIILAILGGIVFVCCALFFLLFIAASFDSSFQSEMSHVAGFM